MYFISFTCALSVKIKYLMCYLCFTRNYFFFPFFLYLEMFTYREGTGHLIDLRVNAVGQKETAFRKRVNGMVLLVLGKN